MNNLMRLTCCAALLCSTVAGTAQQVSAVWNPDKGKTYVNPVINADYSDPDVCRVGNDYYMTSSSFNCFPGLQILHSTDLVNWEIVGAALEDYPGNEWAESVQHGKAVWAPAIRHHNGEFYIYCGDPDRGIFMVKAKDVRGPWSKPVWVMEGKGFIDPCPLWDDDGRAYLSHGCAGSRAGNKSVLFVAPMSPDGTAVLSRSRIVYDGHVTQPTIEGTKFYKRNGYYYIFSPAGGVPTGWQVVLRSKSPFGPYEERVVMAQGKSPVNGPHQGAWVHTQNGEDWFLHFQDKAAYGRVVHLQPMAWHDDWPVIGIDKDGDGVGDPVMEYTKPDLPSSGNFQPSESDDFTSPSIGLQWQWHGIPSPYWSYQNSAEGYLRLYSVQNRPNYRNLSDCPNLLLQKFPAEDFTATAHVKFVSEPKLDCESAGFMVMGLDYTALRIEDTGHGICLKRVTCTDALDGTRETVEDSVMLDAEALPRAYSEKYFAPKMEKTEFMTLYSTELWMRLKVEGRPLPNGLKSVHCRMYYSTDGKKFKELGREFTAQPGKWIGAKMGFFSTRTQLNNDSGWLQVEDFVVGK